MRWPHHQSLFREWEKRRDLPSFAATRGSPPMYRPSWYSPGTSNMEKTGVPLVMVAVLRPERRVGVLPALHRVGVLRQLIGDGVGGFL